MTKRGLWEMKPNKKFKFDPSCQEIDKSVDRNAIQPNPEKSSGILGRLGRDLVAKIGTHLLYHHTWVNFMCTCPLAFRACTEPGLNPRSRWNIRYDDNGRKVHWAFDVTKGYYDIRRSAVVFQVTDPEVVHIKFIEDPNNISFPEEPVFLMINPQKGIPLYKATDTQCLDPVEDNESNIYKTAQFFYADIYFPGRTRLVHTNLQTHCPFVDAEGTFLFGMYCEYNNEEKDFEEGLDPLFAPEYLRTNRAVYVQSKDLVKKIQSEMKYFIHHLGMIF